MADTKTVIEQAYSAFNRRDIDGALALMTEDVSWPKASEGGRVVGKEEIRSYWSDNGASSIPMSNRWRSPRAAVAKSVSGCTNSSRAFKGMSYRTAKFSMYSL
jgi:hypothetical protein